MGPPSRTGWGEGTTDAQLKRVQMLEHKLERFERHFSIDKVVRAELETEVSQKEQLALDLTEGQKRTGPPLKRLRTLKGKWPS